MIGLGLALAAIVIVQILVRHIERREWAKERMELIQRLQSPERASAAYLLGQAGEAEPIPPIALDDDQAYEKLRLEREGAVPD